MSNYKPYKNYHNKDKYEYTMFDPNWVITDMRFPNELKAIEDRKGLTLRVGRPRVTLGGGDDLYEHPSETALDNAEFNYHIDNDKGLVDLVQEVRKILLTEKLI